jgi:hypothetical protein
MFIIETRSKPVRKWSKLMFMAQRGQHAYEREGSKAGFDDERDLIPTAPKIITQRMIFSSSATRVSVAS